MSSGDKLTRAIKKAQSRDKKRKTNMKVSGTSVFALEQLKNRPRHKK